MNTAPTPRIEQFLTFYNNLSSANLEQLAQLYHADITFIDPVHQLNGRQALSHYFAHAYERLQQCRFTAAEKLEQAEQGFISWKMQFAHPAIAKGKLLEVDGCSVLRWQDNMIIYQRDYYDLDAMVFQHLPILGWLTAKVKHRMANSNA
ncbi:nuclear transport factor 2 family protein [Rheinheimera metallidurans]|uniref:nuclear transport factor 2 family protein n=1 Tax=Rheinheimera metallidurans TaxID=2925781 RepID=UPI003002EF9B